jgi:uncharacterized membrane protein
VAVIISVLQEQVIWENNTDLKRKINWGMVISHHPPCQFNRTFRIGKLRFCTRCTAIVSGILLVVLSMNFLTLSCNYLFIATLFLPLPAIFNFTLNELGIRKNNNFKRAATGFLMGMSIGISLWLLAHQLILMGFLSFLWVVVLEFAVAFFLHKKGVLEPFIAQYERAIYTED